MIDFYVLSKLLARIAQTSNTTLSYCHKCVFSDWWNCLHPICSQRAGDES